MGTKDLDFRLAVKGFIVRKNKLFVLKRASDDVQSPNIWEIPGGRLEIGEDPIIGLMREIREETGLYVRVFQPLTIRHFTRKDNQIITMIIFICKPIGGTLKLSKEHSASKWMDFKDYKNELNEFFHKEAELFIKKKSK